MEACTVLSDAVVHDILMSLSKDEILTILRKIEESLVGFSVGDERSYQPEPGVVNRPDGRKNLFRTFTSPTAVGVKIIVQPPANLADEKGVTDPVERNKLLSLHGIIALCNENGFPIGMINAEEVTGHRTSMSAMILYMRRRKTDNIVVFGAGKQALWHIRLVLGLRGDEIKRITVINRSADRTKSLLEQITKENGERWKASTELESVDSGNEKALQTALGEADAIFCTTGSQQPLFPASHVTNHTGCYISAIGSWQAQMIELDPEILTNAANRGSSKGVVIVDDRHECMKASGEGIKSGLGANKIMEVGEYLDSEKTASKEYQDSIKGCVEDGFLVYKSVGVGLTDLAAGQVILDLARKRGQGIPIKEF